MNQQLLPLGRVLMLLYVPVMLLFPLGFACMFPSVVSSESSRLHVRGLMKMLIICTLLSPALWLGLLVWMPKWNGGLTSRFSQLRVGTLFRTLVRLASSLTIPQVSARSRVAASRLPTAGSMCFLMRRSDIADHAPLSFIRATFTPLTLLPISRKPSSLMRIPRRRRSYW